MKILVFGKSGQVATALAKARATTDTLTFVGRDEADFTNPAQCVDFAKQINPDAIINAVAYTAVDKAEEDAETALTVNATTPGALAIYAAQRDIPFVHISTDYVFDGSGDAPFLPDSPTNPISLYGDTKRQGEIAVMTAKGRCAIIRTSWVFSSTGGNFVKTMLRLSETRDELTVVADQIGAPTSAQSIAMAALKIASALTSAPQKSGIYHFQGRPLVSWAQFAQQIFEVAGRATKVTPIPTADYPTPAKRPLNSRLDCTTIDSQFGVSPPDWRDDLEQVLNELGEIT